ncbi:MAG TPA: NUDIX domain-containing protein [Polyangiaceae bacterium]|nr:NUDIX domain-containing protein [Polyangiaceae bacterium]
MSDSILVVLVVVPHEGRYLIVEERNGAFFLPAGKVEPGENLIAAAVRETAEEAGILIGLRGLLGFDHSHSPANGGTTKLRFAFVGYPAILAEPKREADHHSRGAGWFTRSEIQKLPLRHPEVLTWIERHERGTPLLPCAAYEPLGLGPPPRSWSATLSTRR